MKNYLLIAFILTLCFSQKALSCCGADYVGIFPKGPNISTNAAFLIDFTENDFPIKGKIPNLGFSALTTTGEQTKLTVIGTNFSGSEGQVFLKVNFNLKIGDTISIKVSSLNGDSLPGKAKDFAEIVSQKKWTVNYQEDLTPPIWANDTVTYSTRDNRHTSAPSYSVYFNPKITDNDLALPYFYEVTLNNQKFICTDDGAKPEMYWGMCGSNFNFGIDKFYAASIKVIDASGNFANQEKILLFKTTSNSYEPEILVPTR